MSNFTSDLLIKPGFSKRMVLLLGLFHVGALGLLLPLTLPSLVKLSLGLILLTNAIVTLRQLWWGFKHPLYGSVWQKNTLKLASFQEARISPNSYTSPWLVILRASLETQTYTWVLFSDALDPVTFRRLRVRLRHPDYE